MINVVFFPENKLSATICDMYNGHVAAVSVNTDTMSEGVYQYAELELFRNNIQGTAFLGTTQVVPSSGTYKLKLKEAEETGRIGYGLYYATSDGSQTQEQIQINATNAQEVFKSILGHKLTAGSYANGVTTGAKFYKPSFLMMRNSDFSYTGDANVNYLGLTRKELMSKPSSTRTYDAINAYAYGTEQQCFDYSSAQVQRAITSNGWYNDFMHWHHMYRDNRTYFFNSYFSTLNTAIGAADVWRATMSEVGSYAILKDCIRRAGSFQHQGKVYVSAHLKDAYKGTITDTVDNAIDTELLQTPLSIKIDLTGTALAGKNIVCDRAQMIRKLANNVWIISVKPLDFNEGYFTFELKEGLGYYYNAATPTLSIASGVVSSNLDCKFVVWRKVTGANIDTVVDVSRTTEYTSSLAVNKTAGYDYYVGAITKSRMSSLIAI